MWLPLLSLLAQLLLFGTISLLLSMLLPRAPHGGPVGRGVPLPTGPRLFL